MIDSLTTGTDLIHILDFIAGQSCIGLDTEFTAGRGATYIQISTLLYGFIFNVSQTPADVKEQMEWEGLEQEAAPTPLRYNELFLDRLSQIFHNSEIKKIGYAFANDIKAIKRLYNGNFEEEKVAGFLGLEKHLFTFPSNMGLSTLVKRHYNLPLNKDM